ncbi:alpha/beta fold hydrolase [Undibacterium sp. Jales W-56]|uniref:YqiA/YcfP family alpha/beta fold hydrolase n=1 Tax=Undibacterium sp. Jales W-56 TaxID=2897325 RepID=UPI0021CECA6A|nr:YqiA/YcfP family alpha/beta fold hydrolase [Undibacterium sp. Jales W-56]MCU6434724.1 alpha/beta fold hydrolase [Undibacterium sp. Jales W-56]
MIVYLHGFRSSPQSFKARMMADYMQRLGRAGEYVCPQLPASPLLAIRQAEQILAACPAHEVTLIGSSLGGFYATWLAERYGYQAVLLNPAVKPPRDLEKYVGVTTAYHSDEVFEFKAGYVAELRAYEVAAITRPERYFLLAATGDEVLDWREMVAHYPGAKQLVIQGSDHGMADFAGYMDQVLAFCDAKRDAG